MDKILIISNNCLSLSNSNGRTLYNLFSDLGDISNLYFYNEVTDQKKVNKFYRISDKNVIHYFFRKQKCGEILSETGSGASVENSKKKRRKTAFTSLLREIIWSFNSWDNRKLDSWIRSFNPNYIIFQCGDAPFQIRIAIKIAERYNLPIFLFNCEDYYFKEYDYMKRKNHFGLFYCVFHKLFKAKYRKLMNIAKGIIYETEYLKADYEKEFPNIKSIVTMTQSDMKNIYVRRNKISNAYYFGNLNVGRCDSIIEIANVLYEIDSAINLHVYSNLSSAQLEKISICQNISIHQMVSYDEMTKLMKNADLLVHCESFDKYYIRDLKNAFSTKIADSLMSGIPFVYYGPESLAESKYLKGIIGEYAILNRDSLHETLSAIINESVDYKLSAEVFDNHSLDKNKQLIQLFISKQLIY